MKSSKTGPCYLLLTFSLTACGTGSLPSGGDATNSSTSEGPEEKSTGLVETSGRPATSTSEGSTTTGEASDESSTTGGSSTSSGSSTTDEDTTTGETTEGESSNGESSSTGMGPDLPPPDGHATSLCVFDDGRAVLATSEAYSVAAGRASVRLFDADGGEVWARGFGDPELATYLNGLACVGEDTIYAVGIQGEGAKWTFPQGLVMRLDASTGATEWEHLEPQFTSSIFRGLHADATGVYVSGWRANQGTTGTMWRYDPDGNEQWMLIDGLAGSTFLRDVLHRDGVLYTVGEDNSRGILVRLSEDGAVLGSHTFSWSNDVSADIVVPDPTGGVVVVGRRATNFFDRVFWTLACNSDGCADERIEVVEDEDELGGFAIDGSGRRVISGESTLYIAAPDDIAVWEQETGFTWPYFVGSRTLLGIAGDGTVVVAGGEPALVVRLTSAELPPI